MNAQAIRELLRQRPFIPFKVLLSNGESYEIRHPECASFSKAGLVITFPESYRINVCSWLHIAGVEILSPTDASA